MAFDLVKVKGPELLRSCAAGNHVTIDNQVVVAIRPAERFRPAAIVVIVAIVKSVADNEEEKEQKNATRHGALLKKSQGAAVIELGCARGSGPVLCGHSPRCATRPVEGNGSLTFGKGV
ncbi:hypothetical protein [Roseicyclus elongatus]|uniref:hypothetical protein n=1 Tax=Roseicyclus elongatus TaxID=159346 RepID=UPI0012EB0B8E|nr:hypothetical protein [Roseibacterium elongatum]